jgi:hypothetical protein
MYRAITAAVPGIEHKFKQHIHDIENQYHTDQTGNFVQLWPELEHLCK